MRPNIQHRNHRDTTETHHFTPRAARPRVPFHALRRRDAPPVRQHGNAVTYDHHIVDRALSESARICRSPRPTLSTLPSDFSRLAKTHHHKSTADMARSARRTRVTWTGRFLHEHRGDRSLAEFARRTRATFGSQASFRGSQPWDAPSIIDTETDQAVPGLVADLPRHRRREHAAQGPDVVLGVVAAFSLAFSEAVGKKHRRKTDAVLP